jgi:uncharacterized SAM-binding protein YcdF (DUF218 family)
MSTPSPRRAGRFVFIAFILGFLVFAAVVVWLVTGPVRALRNPPARPAEAPAGQTAPAPGR